MPLAAALLAAVAAAGAVLLLAGDWRNGPKEAAFLGDALGARDASAPLVRTPAPGVRVELRPGGYAVASPAGSVGLRAVQNGGAIVRHANGVSQATEFGSAAVVVDAERTEQFLTVTRRQGEKTWRWQLDTSLVPRVGDDGAVVFLSGSSRRVAGPVLAPVRILDARGRDVTPEGARWSTGLNRKGWELRLTIDDGELPLPYVIDPAVTHRATTVSNNGAAGANTINLAYPGGVAQSDLLVATIAVRGGVTVGTPAGWAAGRVSQNGTNVRLFTFYKVATAGEPASQSFTWTGTQQAVGAISAYYGIKASLGNAGILDAMGAAGTGNSNTASAPSITTTTANALVVASYGINNNGTFGPVAGMTERWDAASASATLANRASGSQSDSTQVAAGATGAKTSALGAVRRWAAHLHSFEVDNVNPVLAETVAAVGRATLNLTSTVSDSDSGIASVLYERSPAGGGTWTTVGTSSTSPWSFPFDTTAVADGLYDIRVTATDWAGNAATATGVLRVDNSSPDQNPLTLTPLTGTANQYWDATNRVLYYNPAVAGTFSLSSVPRDVQDPISFVGGSGGANNNSPLTLTVPPGVQAGDLLLAQVGYERTMAVSVPTPAGWTRYVDRDNGTIYGQVIFYRWATASEPASYTLPHASGAASISGTLLAYRGVASVSPVMADSGTVATGSTLTAPSITTPAGCGRLLAFYGLWNTATLTTPTGMTQRATAINTEAGWNSRVLAADEILGAAGASGTRVSTATVTGTNSTGPGSNVSELLALRPLACVSSVQYPAPGQTGFTGGGNTDTVEPYAASPDYSFGPANTVGPGARTITTSDEAGNPALTQSITFTRDVAAPTTTDDTGTITNAWRNADTTVTLSPGDGTGAGVAQTYYTTDGSAPTTGSPAGTSILLTAEGTYTIRYFSTDRVANTEAVKMGAAQIRIDKTNPTSATLDALPASIRNGQSLTGGGADALAGIGSITYLYCSGVGCTPGTTIGSSSTAAGGYPVTWNSQPADGTYRVQARVFDAAGNQLDSAIQTVAIDNTNPTGSVTAPAAGANVRGSSVSVASDSADGGSGVADALFQRSPAGAGTWTTIGPADATSPYGVAWDTTAVADGLYDLRVVTTDAAGNAFTSAVVAGVRVDNTNPSGAVTAPAAGANVRGSSVSVTSSSSDGGSGVADALFQRSPAGAGTWTTIGAADTTSPYGVAWDTTAVADGLYDLRVVTTDNAGNAFTSATIANVRVDNILPTQSLAPTGVSPAGSAYLSGADLFYRGSAAGQLRIRSTVADGGSGPASSTTSALGGTSTGWTHTPSTVSTPAGGPYDSNLFSWGAGTTTSPTVDVRGTDAAGNDSATATLTLRNDSTAPTGGALTVNGVAATAGGTSSDSNGSFTIGARTDWAETASPTASGLASSMLTRESATYANGTCGSYGGSTVIVGAPAQSLGPGCYRYTLAGLDNVGNSVSISTDVRVHGALDRFAVEAAGGGAIGSQTAGSPFSIRVTALDVDGNTVTSFGGTVDITSNGGLSAGGGTTAAFANGVLASQSVTLTNAGSRTITATRTSGGSQSGTSAAFSVGHASLAGFRVEAAGGGAIPAQTVDAPFSIRVTARDAYGNTVTAFDGAGNTVDITSSGTLSTGGGTSAAFASGVLASHSVTLSSPGSTTITATRTSGGSQNGTSAAFPVGNATFTQNAPAGASGTAQVGRTLTRVAGNWSPAPTGRTYQWRRCDSSGASCADIAGASGTTYVLVAADLGATIRVVETAAKAGYDDGVSTSAATAAVAPGTMTETTPVGITGTAKVGGTLTRAAAAWSPGPTSRSYQWRRCDASGASCADIAGATGTTYDLVAADLGATIRVVETASLAGYDDAASTSAQTAVVTAGTIVNVAVPTVSGSATTTSTLTATRGDWTPAGTSGAFQWVRCEADGSGCVDVAGATGSAYVVASADVGKKLKVRETASKAGYDDASADSALTGVVVDTDVTPPTNTITLAAADGAYLSGTTVFYNGAAGGAFTLSSAVADSGAGPQSAAYPPLFGYAGGTVSTPAGGPYLSGSIAWSAGTTGSLPYVVTARDAWTPPNEQQTTLTITDDSAGPSASAQCNGAACAGGWYTSAPVSVALAGDDGSGSGVAQLRYTLDGSDPTAVSGFAHSAAFDVTGQGVTTVKVRAFDRVGNAGPVVTVTIRIDTVAPQTTLDSTPAAASQDTTPAFAYSADEASTFQWRLDGGSWTTDAGPVTLGPLAESTYLFEVRATDVAGNVDPSPASFTFTVDTTAADTTITAAPPAASSSTGASFSFTASDAGPGFECRLDGGAWADCTSPKSYSGLTEAAHTFEVRAEDAAGNLDATPATHAWTVDLTAPDTSFLSTPSDPSASTTPTFGLASNESPATFQCNLDGGGWAPCSTPFTTPALGDGSHTLQVRASDAAGNQDATAVSYTWLVDATAPTGSITNPANGAALGGTVVLASDSADAGGSGVATVVFQRTPAGGSTWTNQAASWDTSLVADGDYDLRVVTTDKAGNVFRSPVLTVTVDNTEPSLSVVAPNPVNLATADPAAITAAASDAGTGIANVRFDQCAEGSPSCVSDSWVLLALDTAAPYSASWPVPSDGPRLLRVRATDNAGKQKTELVLVTVDRTRPAGSLSAPAAGANLRGASVALAAAASDTAPGTVNSVTFQVSPAGAGSWTDVGTDSSAPYAGSLDTTALADGLYDLRVFTTDAAGNAEAAPATVQVRIDNTSPTGSITSPADGANLRGAVPLTSNSADAGSGVDTVLFERSPAGGGSWTSVPSSFDTTAVADGLYDLRVRTTDNAGNAFTSPAITVRVDNTLPTGSVTAPANGANVRGTVALTSDAADAGSGVATVVFQRSPAGAGSWTNQASSVDTTAVADGLYDLRVRTTDNAGNVFTSAAITVRVDNTVPTGSVTAPANGAEIGVAPVALTSDSADPLVSGSASGVATVVFQRSPAGAGTWTSTPATWDTASGPDAVADGQYDLRVRTTDNAGNVFTSAAITVLVDHTAPTTTASLAPGSPSNAPVTVSFSAGDGTGSGVSITSYRVDGGTLQAGAAVVIPAPGDGSNDGAHVVDYFSTDEVGNVESPKSVTVVIDTTAPGGSGGNPGDYLRGIANLTYSSSDSDVSSVQFQFSPAGTGAWTNVGGADLTPPYEASWNTTLVADGQYDLRAVVTDTTGNVANTLLPGLPKTVDNTAPSGSVTAPVAAAVVSGTIAVDANASDGAVPPASGVSAVRFEVKPSGSGAFSVIGTQTSPIVGSTYRQSLGTTSLADGPTELRVVVTDVAGNETTSATRTITVDNDAPVVTLDYPGAAVGASVELTASSSGDTTSVAFRYRPVGSGGLGTLIGTDSTAPFGVTWTTAPAAETQWELIAVATDVGGNTGTSAPRTVLVDRTQPTGSVTAPAVSATVGGPAVALGADADDTGGSGVTRVEWEVKPFGSGTFAPVASDTSAPYTGTWDSTKVADGAAEIRAVVTDAAGNVRTTAVVPVTLDSTGPTVTLGDPGAVVGGTVALSAATAGGAARVVFSVSPADAGTWTQIAEDTSSPFGANFDTTALADGLYDLRAIGYDGLGNPSAPSDREDVRLDNTGPTLVSSAPADGSVSVSVNQIELTVSEPVTVVGATFDGGPAPAPTVSGTTIAYSTGALSEGLHVLFGWLEDASGTRTPFRVAVTIESTPQRDRPPVEKNMSPTAPTSAVAPGSVATVAVTPPAWPTKPTTDDFLVINVDPSPTAPSLGAGLTPVGDVVAVTARWALAGTPVTEFSAPIEVLIPNPSGAVVIPATSDDGTNWRALAPVDGTTLPAGARDGFYVDAAGVHILTRHLTLFALGADVLGPTPPYAVAGEMRADGLTIRWIPGRDNSGRLGNVVLYVNGEPYRTFGPTEYEAKLGPMLENDTRSFYLVQYDAARNPSPKSETLRALPKFLGLGLDRARAALTSRGIGVGSVTYRVTPGVVPGTVIGPENLIFAVEGGSVDLVVAGTAAQARFAFDVANAKRIKVQPKRTSVAVNIRVTRPANVTGMLFSPQRVKLYTWRLNVKAGRTVLKLRLPAQVRKPGTYRIVWVAAAAGQSIRRSVPFTLVGKRFEQVRPPKKPIEVVLTGGNELRKGVSGQARVVASATPDRTFLLVASRGRNVSAVIVDVDRYGLRFVRDLHTVFPELKVVALSRRERTREASLKAGAVRALPRRTTAATLTRVLARVTSR